MGVPLTDTTRHNLQHVARVPSLAAQIVEICIALAPEGSASRAAAARHYKASRFGELLAAVVVQMRRAGVGGAQNLSTGLAALAATVEEALLEGEPEEAPAAAAAPPSAGVPPPAACESCGATEKKLRRCGSCKMVYYCSTRCQRIDWDISHKAQCAELIRRAAAERVALGIVGGDAAGA